MESHIKAVGILHIVLGSLGVIAALILLLVFGGIAGVLGTSSDETALAAPIVGGVGGIIFLVILVLSLPGLIGGIGLLYMAPWSRVFMIVISALDLLSVPLGTAIGIYGIWTLTKPEAVALFERSRYQSAQ
jgi:hypothetical protein